LLSRGFAQLHKQLDLWFRILVNMKSFLKLGGAVALGCFAVESAARAVGYSPKEFIKPYKREALQDIVSGKVQISI
jgi:hypothetical protein